MLHLTRQARWYGMATGVLAAIAGVAAVCLAVSPHHFAALVALGLSIGWGAVSATLVVSAFNARRVHAEMQERTVQVVLDQLIAQLEAAREEENPSRRAELIDRLHALASTALAKP